MPNRYLAYSYFKYLIITGLTTVVVIGLCVIVGWHLHLQSLVQIIPGTIPMQYNTALCFITLALSAMGIISERIPRPVCVITSSLVSLVGLLVVFQYLTGVSIGIDTLFFYPWNQTLSADPGRMALTTAFCFFISGISLSLLILNPRTLIVFVLAHTFPLSLGLTSLIGYLFGITYVLPFHLGTQMAIHTAAAFTIYGITMILYIWQFIPQTQDKLPKWAPSIAIIMIPVFFVSLNSSFFRASFSGRLSQLFLAVAGAALFALMFHKLLQTRIIYKGLILISIPLIFVLGFVLLVNQQKRENEKVNALLLHSKEVIAHAHTLTQKLVEAESNIRGYVISNNVEYRDAFELLVQQIPLEIKTLQDLVRDNPEQLARAEDLGAKAMERIAILENTKKLVDTNNQAELSELTKRGVGRVSMNKFHFKKDEFLHEEKILDEIRQQEVESSWQQFDWLLASGASADLLLALTLAFLFTRGIGWRIRILTENAKALTDGEELAEPLAGNDEIAKLDLVFHQMADALIKAQTELESKVEERTKELSKVTEEIKKINETLEDRVVERTAELEAVNKDLSSFTYSVSHDLRAPLRAINGFANIFIEDYGDKLDDEGRRILNVIRSNAQNMGNLIDDLLEFSRLGRKPLEVAEIDMRQLAEDVCEQIESSLEKMPNIKIEQIPNLKGDRALIRQVLVNLVSNAAKYSQKTENALIKIDGSRGPEENTYYIRDNGVGFDMKYINKLFGVFQRLHSADEFEGTGVGLAIVQRIIQRHGGRVWAEGEINKGATFYFAVPHNHLNQKEIDNESE